MDDIADPFKDAGRSNDPFKDAGRSNDPFKDAGRGVGLGQGPFGGGFGWAVVAFFGPVGLDVGQMAARMLSGGSQSDYTGPAVENVAAMALKAARKRAETREQEHKLAAKQLVAQKRAVAAKRSKNKK